MAMRAPTTRLKIVKVHLVIELYWENYEKVERFFLRHDTKETSKAANGATLIKTL